MNARPAARILLAALFCLASARAAEVVATSADSAPAAAGGETVVLPGIECVFESGHHNLFDSVRKKGQTLVATVAKHAPSRNYFVGVPLRGMDITRYRYVEIEYSLEVPEGMEMEGGHSLFLQAGTSPPTVQTITGEERFPSATGDHRVVVDLLGGTFKPVKDAEKGYDLLRWNFWNGAKDKPGLKVTLHKITFGTELKK
jgi:hypothetical protein